MPDCLRRGENPASLLRRYWLAAALLPDETQLPERCIKRRSIFPTAVGIALPLISVISGFQAEPLFLFISKL